MSLIRVDIAEKDLSNPDSCWEGPVDVHWHTARRIAVALERHGLDLVAGLLHPEDEEVHFDVVPQQEEVESSMLEDISYDDTTRKMSVTFKQGSRYDYFDVEKSIFNGLKESSSKGKYFWKHIRHKYRSKQVD